MSELYTKHDLAKMFGCEPRAVVRMASKGLWPSTKILGAYRFTPDMVKQIISQEERWPEDRPSHAAEPKRQPTKQTRTRRTAEPLVARDNVRPLVAKPRRTA